MTQNITIMDLEATRLLCAFYLDLLTGKILQLQDGYSPLFGASIAK